MAITKKLLPIELNEDVIGDLVIGAVQNDSDSRFLDVLLTDGGLPVNLTNCTVRLSAVKPDGRRVFNNCTVPDAAGGRFLASLTDQMLARTGKLECQFTVFSDAQPPRTLSTKVFNIVVTKSLIDYDALESVNEYGAAVILFQYAEEMRLRTMAMDDLLTRHLDMKVSGVNNAVLDGFGALDRYLEANLKAMLDVKLSTVNAGLNSLMVNMDAYLKAKLDTLLPDIVAEVSKSGGSGMTRFEVFNVPGEYTWTKPQGVNVVEALVIGGGGGGGGGLKASYDRGIGGGGGGAGAIFKGFVEISALPSVSIIVGAGGIGGKGGTSGVTLGTSGSVSNFGLLITCPGGSGGGGGDGFSAGGMGGNPRYATLDSRPGEDGQAGQREDDEISHNYAGWGGNSYNSSGGKNANNGTGYGSGGGGGNSTGSYNNGGNGAGGLVIVRY